MTEPASTERSSASAALRKKAQLPDRLLAEATAAWERSLQHPIDDRQANAAAIAADGDFEHRLIVRAGHLPAAAQLNDAVRQVQASMRLIVAAAVIFALLGGAGAARALLGAPRDEPVNIFLTLGSILGLQTALLLAWAVMMVAALRSGGQGLAMATLGGLVVRLGQWLGRRLHNGPHHAAAVVAISTMYATSSVGKWTLSAISHGLWLAFNLGCLVMVIVLLGARDYIFAWETTILSDRAYTAMTNVIAGPLDLLGFATPNQQQVADSRWTKQGMTADDLAAIHAASPAWAGLLVGAIVTYGLGPRLLLLGWCLGQRRAARARYRIDTSRPEYMRLHASLMPVSQSLGVIDGDDGQDALALQTQPPETSRADRPLGPPAILGFELVMPQAGAVWPPRLDGVQWREWGIVDTRDDQRRVLRELQQSETEPCTIVVVCSLTTTPDRGVGAFLGELNAAANRPLTLVLTGGHALRKRGDVAQLEQRIEDWYTLARRVDIDPQRIIELDLDHLTRASETRLLSVLQRNGETALHDAASPTRNIERAFDVISEHAARWLQQQDAAPSAAAQAELHRQIAQLYRDAPGNWMNLIAAPNVLNPADALQRIRSSADRMVSLLPDRLRRSPKWLAAGAAAGALGCVAAATFISPIAISALPMWSAIGAALGAIIQPAKRREDEDEKSNSELTADRAAAMTDAVRAAALFAMLLELQGRNEAGITRVLDAATADLENDQALDSPQAVRVWLDQLRHQFDMAMAREAVR